LFLIDKNEILTTEKISKIIQTFETSDKPRLIRYKNYFDGKQDILMKTVSDASKPCNRIVTNYCNNIVQNYLGYLTGIPITYSGDRLEEVQDILNYNDIKTEDSELLKNALIYGIAYEVNYIDEDTEQRFKVFDSRECIPVYDNSLNHNLMYMIRYFIADTLNYNSGYTVEIYDNQTIKTYKCDSLFGSLTLIEEVQHYYGQVPVTVFTLNAEEVSIFDKIMTLQDAYNKLQSSEVDDVEAFCDAYMILKGVTADAEDLSSMKQNRVLLLEENSSADYLTKSVSDTQVENLKKNINDNIHKIANSPDFNDDKFMAQSGIAMRYKLTGFENVASSIVANMTKALQRRIELICSILNLTASEATWRDIDIIFTRNLPVNTLEIAQQINQLRGIVSDETLISLLPFIDDVSEELKKLQAQNKANASLYAFNTGGAVDGTTE